MLVYVLDSPAYQVFCLGTALIGVTMFGIHKAWQWAWNRAMKGKSARKSMWD
jgi:hypothetical protein